MKYPRAITFITVSFPILVLAPATWAAEPSTPAGPNAVTAASTPEAPPAPTQPEPGNTPNGAAAATAPVVGDAVANPSTSAASPNSLEASPYDASTNAPAAPMASPAPPPRNDAPATLFDGASDYAIGGFGGFGVSYTRLAGGDRPLVCGEGAVIIDHTLTLGGGGCGVVALMDAQSYGAAPHDKNDRMTFGYGGAIARYHFFSRRAVNFAVGGLIGAGGVEVGTWNGKDSRSDFNNYTSKTQDPVFVFEPQVGGYANLTRWLRFGAVAGYRFVSGVDIKGLRSKDLMGPTIGGQVQAGWF